MPQIWVDADACPNPVKEILYRAAKRGNIVTTFVANQYIKVPGCPYLKSLQVQAGFDVADDKIVSMMEEGDIIISDDIPLAAEVIDKKGLVLNFRGEQLTSDNVKSRLNMRDFMETMRSSGLHSGGPAAFDHTDRQNFANSLDRLLAKL